RHGDERRRARRGGSQGRTSSTEARARAFGGEPSARSAAARSQPAHALLQTSRARDWLKEGVGEESRSDFCSEHGAGRRNARKPAHERRDILEKGWSRDETEVDSSIRGWEFRVVRGCGELQRGRPVERGRGMDTTGSV